MAGIWKTPVFLYTEKDLENGPSCSTCHNFKVNRLDARGLRMPLTAVKMAKAKSWNCESREICPPNPKKLTSVCKDHLIVVLRFIYTYTFFSVYVWKHPFFGWQISSEEKNPGTCGLKLCLKGWDGVAMHAWMTRYISTKTICTFFFSAKITQNSNYSKLLYTFLQSLIPNVGNLRILHTCTKKGF